jgi:glycosyltransferase involved in cell wall biosynthesis
MNDDLEIVFLSTSMGLGGADQQILSVSTELINRGHEVRIISLRPLGPMGEKAREAGATVTSLNVEEKWRAPIRLLRLRHLVGDADIFHTHMFHANLIGRLWRPFLSIEALVNTIHNVFESRSAYTNPRKKTIRNYAYEFTRNRSDFTSCVSLEAYNRFVDIGALSPDTASIVYNGVDTEKFQPSPSARERVRERHDIADEFVWLSVGRFFEQKDHATLLSAFERMEALDTYLWLIGHGELRSELAEKTERLGIEHRVRFLGTVDDVAEYMAAADGFTLSSKWEGFGIVFAEAQACGLPVVATDVGGIPEVVKDGESGFLVPPENPQRLATALDRIVRMPTKKRSELGTHGRQNVEQNFSITAIADQWEEIYRNLVA